MNRWQRVLQQCGWRLMEENIYGGVYLQAPWWLPYIIWDWLTDHVFCCCCWMPYRKGTMYEKEGIGICGECYILWYK